jgi:hypothetical protein
MASTEMNSKTSIEIIVYLASLASEQQAVSAMLDPMRRITAALKPGQTPSPEQEKDLQSVRRDIEHYLVVDEPFKELTPELLEDRVAKFCEAPQQFRVPWGMLGLVGFAIAAATGMASLPVPLRETQAPTLALIGFLSALSLGASWMFLMAMPSIRKTLRPALALLTAGIAYDCLAQLQLPALIITNNLGSLWGQYALYLPMYLPAPILFFLGLRQFARILGVPNTWSRVRVVVGIGVAYILLIAFIPHATTEVPEWAFRLTMIVSSIQVAFEFLTIQLTLRIIGRLTSTYATTMKHFLWSVVATAISTAAYTMSQVLVGGLQNQHEDHMILIALTILPSLMAQFQLAWAGYSFRRASRR